MKKAAQHSVHADPAPLRLAGQAGWILTAKMALFVALGFIRFVGESRPASCRYPLQGVTRSPNGDDVLYRMISRAVRRQIGKSSSTIIKKKA